MPDFLGILVMTAWRESDKVSGLAECCKHSTNPNHETQVQGHLRVMADAILRTANPCQQDSFRENAKETARG